MEFFLWLWNMNVVEAWSLSASYLLKYEITDLNFMLVNKYLDFYHFYYVFPNAGN